MGRKAKQRSDRPKRRKFHGNKYVKRLKVDGVYGDIQIRRAVSTDHSENTQDIVQSESSQCAMNLVSKITL